MDPLPYNITLSSQSPAFVYSPSHAENGTPEGAHNNGTVHGVVIGAGEAYVQATHSLASMSLTWVGTVVYLYGFSTSPESYWIEIDEGNARNLRVDPESNLLASVTGLSYGNHTISLHNNDVGATLLTFHYAVLTIGIGYESSFQIQKHSVPAAPASKRASSETSPSVVISPTRRPVPVTLKADIIGGVVSVFVLYIITTILAVDALQKAHGNAGTSNITPFVGTKFGHPQRGGSRSKCDLIHDPERAPPSPSSSESNPTPSVGPSVTRHVSRHLQFTSQSSIHEVDAGPMTLPPRYDHSWVVNADANESAPAPAASRRVLPIPPGPPPPPTLNEKVVASGPSSSRGWS
ncbi:hypothetical protein Moror_5825 [Moniliophthora roreri MCA 2997]|uniref:Uncharacterized protein n=1 Tax=Moniliophthora roreri (strain MCA 2997) TaxID=1381753 RepID=V2X099_MONRO|nr:hypothetical protein Moror_5825 [Moniliophthora roreri MCA 2997]